MILFLLLSVRVAGWIESLYKVRDELGLGILGFRALRVIPALIVVKIWPLFVNVGSLYDLIFSEFIVIVVRLVVVVQSTVVEDNVCVPACAIREASRHVFSPSKNSVRCLQGLPDC